MNFTGGALQDWSWIGDRLYFSGEPQAFYVPVNTDPVIATSARKLLAATHGRGAWSLTLP